MDKEENDKPADAISRRSFVTALGLSAVGLSGCSTVAKKDMEDLLRLFDLAQKKVEKSLAGILDEVANGSDVQELSRNQRAVLRHDVSSLFPADTSSTVIQHAEQVTRNMPIRNEGAFVATSEKGIITAYRKVEGGWQRAGWDAPTSLKIHDDDQAFRDSPRPYDGEPGKFFSPLQPNRPSRI